MERVRQSKNKYYDPYGIPDCDFHQENIIEYHTRNEINYIMLQIIFITYD